jgi:hypothetical protein
MGHIRSNILPRHAVYGEVILRYFSGERQTLSSVTVDSVALMSDMTYNFAREPGRQTFSLAVRTGEVAAFLQGSQTRGGFPTEETPEGREPGHAEFEANAYYRGTLP